LEVALGRKSLESDLFRVIVDLASEEYKVDLKKKFWRSSVQITGKMRHSYLLTLGKTCEILGVSRQAYYKRTVVKAERNDQVIALASVNLIKARKKCPTLSC
jgi:hypothetical protein